MKYLSILRFSLVTIVSVMGKLLAPIMLPIAYYNRNFLRNYTWNWLLSKGIVIKRGEIVSEDETKYHLKAGYIKKRQTSWLGWLIVIPYLWLDDLNDLDCCNTQFVKDTTKIKGLVNIGGYFDIGDKQRANNIDFTDWFTLKHFLYWCMWRNPFYNFNYLVEETLANSCGDLALEPSKHIIKYGANNEEFSEHSFYQDNNGKWFFIMTYSRCIKGKYYGYEIGYRRDNKWNGYGVNQLMRLYYKK